MIAASSVVFPAPLGPMTVTIVPRATLSDTSCTASTLPYATDRFVTSRSGAVTGPPSAALRASRLARARGGPARSCDPSQIRFQHHRVALDLAGQPFRELHTEVHHDETVREPHDEVHVVLDQQHRHALCLEGANELRERLLFE